MSICFKLIVTMLLEYMVNAETIIGGNVVKNHSRPYMVLLETKTTGGGVNHCGGFLISRNFVMTAAHCQAESYNVFLGLQNYYQLDGVQQLSVTREFLPKNHTMEKNDIMLLMLSHEAKFNKHVQPIRLAERLNNHFIPSLCSVAGWGRTVNSSRMSVDLMEVNVTLLPYSGCVHKGMYCSSDGVGPGMGDSGGPLLCLNGKMEWEAYGVVSGEQSINYTPFNMYAKIGDNLKWIRKCMEYNKV